MSSNGPITLGLIANGGPVEYWRQFAETALDVIHDALSAADDSDWEAERAEIERCRVRLAAARGGDVQLSAEACLKACRTALQRIETRQRAKRGEIAVLITNVREAVAALREDGPTLSSSLDESTARMNALAEIDDPRQLKDRLMTEVSCLKQLVLERRQGWATANAIFEQKVATLETQLVHSQHEASRDSLTGTANRRVLETRMQAWLQSANRQFVFALVDVDEFKKINDTHGHPVGDEVLIALVAAIRSGIRSEDTLARFGGDEFALLLPGLTTRVAETRVRALLSSLRVASLASGHPVTVSCGLSEVAAGDTVASLIARADGALYEAKRDGRNRVCVKSAPFISSLSDAGRKRRG